MGYKWGRKIWMSLRKVGYLRKKVSFTLFLDGKRFSKEGVYSEKGGGKRTWVIRKKRRGVLNSGQ